MWAVTSTCCDRTEAPHWFLIIYLYFHSLFWQPKPHLMFFSTSPFQELFSFLPSAAVKHTRLEGKRHIFRLKGSRHQSRFKILSLYYALRIQFLLFKEKNWNSFFYPGIRTVTQWVKSHPETPASPTRVPVQVPADWFKSSFLLRHLGKQQIMVQMLGLLLLTLET